MSKKIRKIMAMIVAIGMLSNALPMEIAHGEIDAENPTTVISTETDEATGAALTVTTTTTTDDNGVDTITVTIEKEWTTEGETGDETEGETEGETGDETEGETEGETGDPVIEGSETTVETTTTTTERASCLLYLLHHGFYDCHKFGLCQ